MFKMPSFGMNARPETYVPLIRCVVDDILSKAIPDFPHFINVMNLLCVANISLHASIPKEDILVCNVTPKYTNNYVYLVNFVNNKPKQWRCVRYVRSLLLLILRFSQGSVATYCRHDGKYDRDLMAILLLTMSHRCATLCDTCKKSHNQHLLVTVWHSVALCDIVWQVWHM